MRVFILFFPLLLFSNIIVKYLNLKPFYYKNQIINLKIKIISTDKNLSFLSPNVKIDVKKISPYIYILNTHFKADNNPKDILVLPERKIINLDEVINIKTLNTSLKRFSHLFANNITILNPISTKSDDKIILSFSIKCQYCNLEDFKLKEINSSLIEKDLGTFLVYLPINTKKFNFYYFNLKENTFKKVSIPIILKEEKISTQTDINPNENNLLTPLNIIYITLFLLFILLFFIYRKVIIIIIAPFFLIPLIIQILPKGEIILKKGDKLRILPTKNSTIIYIIEKPTKAIILKKIDKFIKVKVNKKIGWIYEKDR